MFDVPKDEFNRDDLIMVCSLYLRNTGNKERFLTQIQNQGY